MRQDTIDRLNQINQDFYNSAGAIWNPNPNYFWEGWYKLLQHIQKVGDSKAIIRVLDIGCGNGRFYNFLTDNLNTESDLLKIDYLGIDFSNTLINQLNQPIKILEFDFVKQDIVEYLEAKNLDTSFDIVCMFGLIHHIPSFKLRNKIFEQAGNLLTGQGILIFTTWQYQEVPRLTKRIVDSSSQAGQIIFDKLGVDKLDLEKGDNILDWVKKLTTYRYSHFFDNQEIESYKLENNFTTVSNFACDGRSGKRNMYYVWRKGATC